jgi:dTDP-4-dehydrorhamnose 3,5-epimerase
MQFERTAIPDVILIQPKVYGDDRGFFMETFRADEFAAYGMAAGFVQDNHSGSQQGILRGLHYQIHQAQGKLVRAITGEIFDVAVDLRRSSPTFSHWVAALLSSHNRKQMWIPAGFAHGFYVLSDDAEVVYKATDYYSSIWERSILWNDPSLGIEWPLLNDKQPILSNKDAHAKLISEAELFD